MSKRPDDRAHAFHSFARLRGAAPGCTAPIMLSGRAAPHSTFRLSLRTSVPHFVSSLSMSLA